MCCFMCATARITERGRGAASSATLRSWRNARLLRIRGEVIPQGFLFGVGRYPGEGVTAWGRAEAPGKPAGWAAQAPLAVGAFFRENPRSFWEGQHRSCVCGLGLFSSVAKIYVTADDNRALTRGSPVLMFPGRAITTSYFVACSSSDDRAGPRAGPEHLGRLPEQDEAHSCSGRRLLQSQKLVPSVSSPMEQLVSLLAGQKLLGSQGRPIIWCFGRGPILGATQRWRLDCGFRSGKRTRIRPLNLSLREISGRGACHRAEPSSLRGKGHRGTDYH